MPFGVGEKKQTTPEVEPTFQMPDTFMQRLYSSLELQCFNIICNSCLERDEPKVSGNLSDCLLPRRQ